jgi:hypothetical protein
LPFGAGEHAEPEDYEDDKEAEEGEDVKEAECSSSSSPSS